MHRTSFRSLYWGVAACWLCTPLAVARVADRPTASARAIDAVCCPYGLGQWIGGPHSYVHGDAGGDAEDCGSLPAPVNTQLVAEDTQLPRHEFYEDVDGDNFDCPYRRNHCHAGDASDEPQDPAQQEEASRTSDECHRGQSWADGECGERQSLEVVGDAYWLHEEDAARSTEEVLSDWRHSAGDWVVNHLNTQNDGLEEGEAGDLDWSVIAIEAERRKTYYTDSRPDRAAEGADDTEGTWFRRPRRHHDAPPPVEPPNLEGDDTHRGPYYHTDPCHGHGHGEDECDVHGNVGDLGKPQEPGRFRQWCGQVWQAVQEAAEEAGQRLERMAEDAMSGPEVSEQPGMEYGPEPSANPSRPPLPDYFLPAFGSPWDGEL
jgi:hypothetical protein